jgi:signal transduction histidine kinase/AraC-like DNA-binding protein
MTTNILLVHDAVDVGELIQQHFQQQIQTGTYLLHIASNSQQALEILQEGAGLDLVLAGNSRSVEEAIQLLAFVQEQYPLVPTIFIADEGDLGPIRSAMNQGAFDFITRPVDGDDLERTLIRALRHGQQLRQAEELKALDATKTKFFTNLIHELRTPLSLIVSPVDELLEQVSLTESQQQRLLSIRHNSHYLLRLINQLIDIHQFDTQQADEPRAVGDLPGFVGQVVNLFGPLAGSKHLNLQYQTDLPAGNYRFDAYKWETILYNLLNNAIRFTETGSVTVKLLTIPTGVRLVVTDTGIGITAHKLPHIFDPFYQGDNLRIRASDPTGISLALVKALTQRLGGHIQVTSEVDRGTEFTIEVPVQRTGGVEASVHATQPEQRVALPQSTFLPLDNSALPTSSDTPLLLIVEENADLLEYMVAELATTYRVRTATTGQQGWVVAREELPDLVITELVMAGLDGFSLVERLKADAVTDHIATVLLTGRADDTSRLKGLSVGADEYLTKPFNLGELRLRLRNLLDRQQRVRDHYRQQLAQPDRSGMLQPVGDQFLGKLYALVDQRLDDSTLSVEWLADQLAMSRKALYLKVQNLTHLAPIELIRQYRLRKAIDLLRAGHGVSETGYLVGFDSPSYFTRVFREFYQQTPTAYLKQ